MPPHKFSLLYPELYGASIDGLQRFYLNFLFHFTLDVYHNNCKMKKEKNKFNKFVADVAYTTARKNVNGVCAWFFHQPELPGELKKLKNTDVK